MSYSIKNELGETVEVHANEKQVFSDIQEGMISARHNEKNEEAIGKYNQSGQDLKDSDIAKVLMGANDIIDAIIDDPTLEVEVGGTSDLMTLPISYVAQYEDEEITESCKEFTVSVEDDKVVSVSDELVLTGLKADITFITLHWISGVSKKIKVTVKPAATA